MDGSSVTPDLMSNFMKPAGKIVQTFVDEWYILMERRKKKKHGEKERKQESR